MADKPPGTTGWRRITFAGLTALLVVGGVILYNPAKGTFTLEGIIGSARVYRSFRFGRARMVPVAGNWDVGANESVGYYDPRTGAFYLRVPLSRGLASEIIRFGQPHMIPLTGDWFGRYRQP